MEIVIDNFKIRNKLRSYLKNDVPVFLECPGEVPGIEFGEPVQVELERTVVASDFFW